VVLRQPRSPRFARFEVQGREFGTHTAKISHGLNEFNEFNSLNSFNPWLVPVNRQPKRNIHYEQYVLHVE
jgi:hypothetical protein